MFIVVVCVCARFLIFDNLSWQVASDQWTSVIAWQVYISRYCCTLVSALEAGNGDAWSEGQDSLGQDGRVLPWRGECPVFRNGWLRWMLRSGMGKLSALGTWSLECFPCTWHLITWLFLNSFAYPKFSQMFPKTSFFFRKHLLSDFWGIKAILKHIYIYIFFLLKKKPTDLDPTDLGLVFDILTAWIVNSRCKVAE